jgi:hypothetical protein
MRLPEVRVYYNPKAADRGTAAAGRSPGVVCSRKPGRHPAVGWQGGLSDRFPRFPRERSVLLRTSPRHRRALAVATPAKGQLRAPQRARDRGSGKVLPGHPVLRSRWRLVCGRRCPKTAPPCWLSCDQNAGWHHRDKGQSHANALRRLGQPWLKIIPRMWMDRKPYDGMLHHQNPLKQGSWVLKLNAA